jgi:hypothetical protein
MKVNGKIKKKNQKVSVSTLLFVGILYYKYFTNVYVKEINVEEKSVAQSEFLILWRGGTAKLSE